MLVLDPCAWDTMGEPKISLRHIGILVARAITGRGAPGHARGAGSPCAERGDVLALVDPIFGLNED